MIFSGKLIFSWFGDVVAYEEPRNSETHKKNQNILDPHFKLFCIKWRKKILFA